MPACAALDLRAERGELALERGVLLLEARDLALQRLDGGEGDAVRVDLENRGVAGADAERGLEVLRHGADVAGGLRLLLVAPRREREPRQSIENGVSIDRREVA